ncbi:MAG: hypothetical protein LCH67_00745 [Bacteroidetes bacterium]|nr:hypothetical protein [Bacteroidota bacterium]
MSNFRLNLPVDIPWKIVNSSEDMMDKTFCDKKMPSPFRSSISLYTYDPKVEDIPEEYTKCGKQLTYLKVSCSITGYQPNEKEKQNIIDLLASIKGVDYSKIDDITREYFGCYGVLLNVSVHPDTKNKDDLTKYPRIIDFEPKVRDFYQAASETGEVLTSSVSKLTTNKSFATTEQTQSSWNAGATVRIPEQSVEVAGLGGVSQGSPGEVRGDTGQVRTETDQANWAIGTDASRERREGQSTTTQLSQMYNLLTGYHSGSNRSSFIMMPRPHILQPTDKRTFVQGLRVIEGIQDFFFIVIRDKEQSILNVDAFLQTGHFPENILVEDNISKEDQYEYKTKDVVSFKVKCLGLGFFEGVGGAFIDAFGGDPASIKTDVSEGVVTFDGFEADGWEFDPDEGDSGHKSIKELKMDDDTLSDFEGLSFLKHVYKCVSPDNVQIELLVKNKNMLPSDGAKKAIFNRKYKVFLRKKKNVSVSQVANINGLLITQRKLCTQIIYNECISSKDVTNIKLNPIDVDIVSSDWFEDIVAEIPFDITPLFDIPEINPKNPLGKRSDFPFKKGIIRMIQNAMLSASNSPLRNAPGTVGYIQSKHFQKRLMQILPSEVLESSIHDLDFINPKVKDKVSKDVSLNEILSTNDIVVSKQFGISKNEILSIKKPDIAK